MRNFRNKSELMKALSSGLGLTVRELRSELENFDDDAIVLFSVGYGDYHNTMQALPVQHINEADSDYLAPTAYSKSGIALLNEDDMDEDDGHEDDGSESVKAVQIVVLR